MYFSTVKLEYSAFPTQCEAGEFRCLSGECIDGSLVLDGKQDCYDNTDEGNVEAPNGSTPNGTLWA